ncbi:protein NONRESPONDING TO OXYLIPINS 2, mitochondrial-like isoform X1 [Nymphaea colorata]|nr:protein NONRESPONDING TO OXYLIPINS 2, mitochondrial-like isoform X1 [Nymphaea colorata]
MASRYSSVSRSLMAAARSSAARPANVPRPGLRPRLPSSATQSRRFTFSSIRTPVELGCVPSLFPLHSAVAASRLTAHVSVSVRACCELSQGLMWHHVGS